MDPGSLDAAVQDALRALYPPFEATAPTLLGQLFRLLESRYGGDGLRCLLDFLIPAKRLFERVRQAACAPYQDCVFVHEGWPLCLREKVVVQLAPLNPLLLRAGDFYLQAEPCAERAARITLKHLSRDLRTVQETPLPEATYALLFTHEWLEGINCGQDGEPLRACLVASEAGVAPLPWSSIATPQFVPQRRAGAAQAAADPAPPRALGRLCAASAAGPYGNVDGSGTSGPGKYPGLIKVEQLAPRQEPVPQPVPIKVEQLAPWQGPAPWPVPGPGETLSPELAGEYVELLELSQEKLELLARSLPSAQRAQSQHRGAGMGSEGARVPGLGRELPRDPWCLGSRGRYRDSYLAALQNPVSFGPRLMGAILEEPAGHVPATGTSAGSSRPGPSSSPTRLRYRTPTGTEGAPTHSDPDPLQPPARPEAPASSHRFSFLKGPRLGASPGAGCTTDRAVGHLEGPWRKMTAIYSPRMGRAKGPGKGPAPVADATAEDGSPSSTHGAAEPQRAKRGSPRPLAWQDLHTGLLLSGIVCLPGSTDKLGRPLLQVSASGSAWEAPWCSAEEVARLLLYLCSMPRRDAEPGGLTVLVDARKQPPSPVLYVALRSVQSRAPGAIRTVLLLANKELAAPRERLPGLQVETLPSLRALGRYVDSSQVTRELDGSFPYCHGEWVQFFQRLQPFMGSLQQALELLRSCTRELRGTAGPAGPQEAAARIARHGELMRALLREPRLAGLQRDGGAALARLRREAARLGPSPHARSSLEAAERLYEQLEEELHELVSTSNSCLQHLEILRKAGELEAELAELGRWLDGEAAAWLEELGACGSPDGSGEPSKRFEELLDQAMITGAGAERRESPAGSAEDAQGPCDSAGLLPLAGALRRLQELVLQVRGARGHRGPAAWVTARQRHRAAQRLLQHVLAKLRRGWAAQPTGHAHRGSAESERGVSEASAASARASPPARPGGVQEGDAAGASSSPSPGGTAWPGDGGTTSQAAPGQPLSPPAPVPAAEQPSPHGDAQRAAHGTQAAARAHRPPPEAAQYFQVSSWSSLSSEDSDSHTLAEESPAPCEPPATPAKPPRILYLERPLRGDPAATGTL